MVTAKAHVPDRGDIVLLTFGPDLGHEQSGRRPAVVLSPEAYNGKTGLALAVPITSKVKGYPFEVMLPRGLPVSGVILADQIKSIDWRARDARSVGRLPAKTLAGVLGKIGLLIGAE